MDNRGHLQQPQAHTLDERRSIPPGMANAAVQYLSGKRKEQQRAEASRPSVSEKVTEAVGKVLAHEAKSVKTAEAAVNFIVKRDKIDTNDPDYEYFGMDDEVIKLLKKNGLSNRKIAKEFIKLGTEETLYLGDSWIGQYGALEEAIEYFDERGKEYPDELQERIDEEEEDETEEED